MICYRNRNVLDRVNEFFYAWQRCELLARTSANQTKGRRDLTFNITKSMSHGLTAGRRSCPLTDDPEYPCHGMNGTQRDTQQAGAEQGAAITTNNNATKEERSSAPTLVT